jgi:hypothetical protein
MMLSAVVVHVRPRVDRYWADCSATAVSREKVRLSNDADRVQSPPRLSVSTLNVVGGTTRCRS